MKRRKIYHARLMYARPFIDSLDFARNGQAISGEMPIAGLSRLLDLLENPRGNLSYTLSGGVDEKGSHFLDVSITGNCQLRCQRCLEAMDHPVRIRTRLLLREQDGLDAPADDEEEPDSILAEKHLDVLNLLEEEILLSLPIAPRHETGVPGHEAEHCQAAVSRYMQQEREHPFAVLANLKHS